jgi:hypothetical protein
MAITQLTTIAPRNSKHHATIGINKMILLNMWYYTGIIYWEFQRRGVSPPASVEGSRLFLEL